MPTWHVYHRYRHRFLSAEHLWDAMAGPGWNKYDPSWLVALAELQLPGEPWLHQSLSQISEALFDGPHVIYFVDRMHGKFRQNVLLRSSEHGQIVLDILEDGRVGSLEFLDLTLK